MKEKSIILYPVYFNSKCPRSKGRRVSKSRAVKNPTVDEIYKAVRALGLNCTIEKDKHHPARWFEREGRIVVSTTLKKTQLIKEVAKKLQSIRGGK